MKIAQDLKRLAEAGQGSAQPVVRRGNLGLTIAPYGQDHQIGFTAWRIAEESWEPLVSGLVEDEDDLVITYCSPSSFEDETALLAELLGEQAEGFAGQGGQLVVAGGWGDSGLADG